MLNRACDAHMHIYDSRFLPDGIAMAAHGSAASVSDYRRVQRDLGTQRTVVVTPRDYGTDNRVTLDAIQQLGVDRARGVAVVHPDISNAALAALHAGGIRGIRFTLYTPANAAVSFDMVEPLSHRMADLGWHVQLHWRADQIVAHRVMLKRLPCTIVFDHMARLPQPAGIKHPAFDIVRDLAETGRVWVKLSGPYLDSLTGAADSYADRCAVAKAWIGTLPERVVWGSDWPHTTETQKPDDGRLRALLDTWADDTALRERILVRNPGVLYDFPF
ncbi:amidohydrolase family protein [Robbsia sp. KACC 23696]|uniref:amidohydrolase family protein n=1 Tax=Robbsia sp. KACC 23696 TaxID=3149231 RepID=UPI00325B68CB